MYIDIHTHQRPTHTDPDVLAIYNLNVPEHLCRCGLDLTAHYSLGIHPWKIYESLLAEHIRFIEDNARFDCVKAIGEGGLDRLTDTPWDLQLRAFRAQIAISEKLEKPLIVHCVKAFDELIALKKEIKPQQQWIIHGFRGKPEQAAQLASQGFYFSFGQHFNEETLRQMPIDRLFLETDDADISIREVYKKASVALNIPEEKLIEQIDANYSPIR